MDMSKFKKFVDFYEIYELVANGEETISGIRDALRLEKGLSGGNLQRRIEYLSSDPPFLTVNQDWVKFEKESFAGILMELIEGLGLRDKFIPPHKKDEEIQEKVRRELERKVLVASTIEVGPEEKMSDGLFLVDLEYYLDVDACVAKYGGELDSFYEELESDDPGKKGFDPGGELTERNYALRTMKTVGTRRFFSKRIRDNKEVAEFEQSYGSVSPVSDKRQEKRKEILRNRFISLNKIIKSDKLTNQEKLMMYAMNSEYHNTNVERLLNYAGEHCLNADLLIYILEDPDVCTTYENTVGFLSQFAQATYGNLINGREDVLNSIKESLSDYTDEEGHEIGEKEKEEILHLVDREIWGYGIIDDLIHDKSISDIKIHNAENIRIKRNGKREGSDITFPSEGAYKSFVTRLLERNKVNLGTANAIQTFTDADQEDFILRLAVIGGLLIVGGSPLVVIRKIPKNKYSLSELSDLGMFGKTGRKGSLKVHFQERFFPEGNEDLDSLFSQMIESRGILFTGKGASGKTTLMNACIEKIPDSDSVMICQENAELFDLHHPDIIAAHVMVNGGDSKVSYNLGDLTRVALLVDLDRVIVGEVKEGSEAAGLSKASMTGHKCWTSVHGANCEMAVEKMADYISQATGYGNREALKQLTGFEYVVHLSDFTVDEIVRIVGFDASKGKLILRKVYPFEVSV